MVSGPFSRSLSMTSTPPSGGKAAVDIAGKCGLVVPTIKSAGENGIWEKR